MLPQDTTTQPQPTAPQPPVQQPVAPAMPKKSRKGLIITLASLGGLLFTAGIVVVVLLLVNQGPWNDPNKFFTAMLDKSMQTTFVTRHNVLKTRTNDKTYNDTADIQTDFSTLSAPLSSWKVTQSYTVDGESPVRLADWEAISGKSYTQYLRYTDFQSSKDLGNIEPNQWYGATNTKEAALLDNSGLGDEYNRSCGILLLGNFTESDRAALMQAYADNKVYSFDAKSVQNTTQNGEDVSVYTVHVSGTGLNAVHKKAGSLASIAVPSQPYVDTTAHFVVSHKTGRLVSVEYAQDDRWKGSTFNMSYTFQYPADLKITMPSTSDTISATKIVYN